MGPPVVKAFEGPAPFDDRFRISFTTSSVLYNLSAFHQTMDSLILFPERTSTGILRADIVVADSETHPDAEPLQIRDWKITRSIRRRLLPRNPKMDKSMLEDCYFLERCDAEARGACSESLIILRPLDTNEIPYYHPQVGALAILYTSSETNISYLPLVANDAFNNSLSNSTSIDSDSHHNRLNRTLLQVLTIVIKHSVGVMNGYQKRVLHDIIVPKNNWQDYYTDLKGRFASDYVTHWAESTDPKKHVFEDLGIASFLVNLWRQAHEGSSLAPQSTIALRFVDVGCGNGLLVDILRKEGWSGYGFDARCRKSWSVYPPDTQDILREMILYPAVLDVPDHDVIEDNEAAQGQSHIQLNHGLFQKDEFLIGNHADELTPFIPLLAAISSLLRVTTKSDGYVDTAGFVIIPCCTYTFCGAKHNSLSTKGGRYASYITWLIGICEAVGWIVEKEALRIPSTRNWAIVGRRRRLVEDQQESVEIDGDLAADRRKRLLAICRDVVQKNGGMGGFLVRAKSLTVTKPRNH